MATGNAKKHLDRLAQTRRSNLLRVAERYKTQRELAKVLGFSQPSYLSQLIGPRPSRPITERSARLFEARLGLALGSLDRAR